ncbi:MAG: ABC transporter permease [Actinomycetota bacterium]|nr:ABC transporter permease [Actinomycetota bacterium]
MVVQSNPLVVQAKGEPEDIDQGRVTAARPPASRRPRRWRRRTTALASYLLMVFALITLNFMLPRAMPGDPIDGLLAQGSAGFSLGEQSRASLQHYYGLNGSLASQYRHYLDRMIHGDLGRSIVTNTPVTGEIGRKLPWTLLLVATSILVATLVGAVAGVQSGWKRDRPADRALMTGLITVWQFPAYLLASIMLFVFAVKLHWLPSYGAQTSFSGSFSLIEKASDVGRHLVMPLVVLTVGLMAWNYLVMRSGMVNELGSDYLLLGRAKGLRPRRLKYRYAARNALLPLVSSVAVDIGFAVAANVFVERVFSYPGLGNLLFGSIGSRDYPMIQGVFLLLSLSIVTVNALADVAYRKLDPRTAV